MKYKAGQRRKAIEYEKDLVTYWKDNRTFEKSVEQRPAEDAYVFYDGPPFITGVPHTGTLLASIVKDVVPRYHTMQGRRVERVWGWDCHGLPAEVFTEKKLGIQDRRDIGTKISLEEYVTTCRANMVQTGDLWETTIDRIGRWVDFKGAYKTMDKNFMESVWWAFQKLYDDGKIYEGERVLLYCTRDATPLSKAEVTMDAGSYQDVTDPSVYVKFKLKGSDTYLLAWTTTPWTLPANTALGVGVDEDYTEVKLADGTHLVLGSGLVTKVLTDEKHQPVEYDVVRTGIKGQEFIGRSYEPLFSDRGENAHRIWDYPGLSNEEGTGIVHLAPAYGEEDYNLSKTAGFPFVSVIDESGFYTEGDWKGQNVWEANKPIAKELLEHGMVWKIDYIKHSYPHCYRCGTKLMYRAHPSWFMDVQGQKGLMLEQNENVEWFPEHLKHGRFQKTIEAAPDWNLSRDRFWATAMPVWKGTDANGRQLIKVVGSYAELKELSGVELDDYHRPWVDDVTFTIDGVEYKRIDKVLDCWFESGSMPFAQFHYPFENKEKFEASFPGDFIVEYVGQVRAWFYYVHTVGVALFGTNSYKNVITTGNLMGNDGRKLSKSLGNFTDPNEIMDAYSADALRFFLMSSPVMNGEDATLKDKDVQDVQRKLAMIWNMYDFFTTYAEVDEWEWNGSIADPSEELTNPLDIWVVSRLHQLVAHVTKHLDAYDLPNALADVLPFLDDASNWYVRRSRRRFWKSEDDGDKNDAYKTLHYVLTQLSLVMAPFTPFLAEELFLKLTGGEIGESVHLLDWPKVGIVNEVVLKEMQYAREAITDGLSKRAEAGIKVRQPLASATVWNAYAIRSEINEVATDIQLYQDIIAEELNVKIVRLKHSDGQPLATASSVHTELDLTLTPELLREGMTREVIRNVQQARKAAGLQVDDRIVLCLTTEALELVQAIKEYAIQIVSETLSTGLVEEQQAQFTSVAKVEGQELRISLSKA
ncbi:isoleucine--tRNA ligase [Aeromicrobium sp.]|nr:isoleucine--tRNA ligase [Candidatus Saccharibacteria bacterium]